MPIRRLARLPERVRLCAKAEWRNPGGSVKDRPAARIIAEALESGRLLPGKTILDASSGNTGIAYGWIGARLGYRVTLAVPASINPERRRTLRRYGVELIETDPLEGSDGAIRKARALAAERAELYFYADQYNNPENWKAHYETTGAEILAQTGGRVTHFVAGLGTSGTFCGTVRRLRESVPGLKAFSVQPDAPFHGLEGLKHMESALVPGIYDPSLADEALRISTEDGQRAAVRAAREEGLLIGPSGGAALHAASRLAERLAEEGRDALVVAILPDGGERYLSERFWEDFGA